MKKNLSFLLILLGFFFLNVVAKPNIANISFSNISSIAWAQDIALEQEMSNGGVVYTLPSPGILPDAPLFLFKDFRDKIMEILPGNNKKKVDLLLLHSDKKLAMVIILSNKGKTDLVMNTLLDSQKKMLQCLHLASKLGKGTLSPELKNRISLSIEKHNKVIDETRQDSLYESYGREFEKMDKLREQINSLSKRL